MIITSASFEVKTPEWVNDPDLPEGFKKIFHADGLAEPLNGLELCHIEDDCYLCGNKLMTPYVYWHCGDKGLSLGGICAPPARLGTGGRFTGTQNRETLFCQSRGGGLVGDLCPEARVWP